MIIKFIKQRLWLPLFKKWDIFSMKDVGIFEIWYYNKHSKDYRVYWHIAYGEKPNPPHHISEIELCDSKIIYRFK